MNRALQWILTRRVALGLTALAVVAHLVPAVGRSFELNRADGSELWRVLTCHLAHFDLTHLFWSGSVFVGLALWLEPNGRARLGTCCVVAAVTIATSVWLLLPDITVYRGLSGIDSALFALALGDLIVDSTGVEARRDRRRVSLPVLLGVAFVAKIAYEIVTGAAVFADSEAFVPVPLAHGVGAATGFLLACLTRTPMRSESPGQTSRSRIFTSS